MPGVGKGQVVAGRTGAGADGAGDAGLLAATTGFLAGAAFLATGFFVVVLVGVLGGGYYVMNSKKQVMPGQNAMPVVGERSRWFSK